ncbi:thioredoxin domain-containing protein [Desulfococcaceae bacterium HSG8]|nr:thioredoxin domain-containing protein [Desulfococcaceae bacterium HSG8]
MENTFLEVSGLSVAAMITFMVLGWDSVADASEKPSSGSDGAVPLPGAEKYDEYLVKKLVEMKKFRGSDYKPRTKHLRPDGGAIYTNRLFLESSPYLNQHAHNPVNWYPWSDEAFETARQLDRPVLLSVGYSTCHWCHVMEEESLEDEEIARFLNKNYIAIKVDREERPGIDAIYMSAVRALTGGGGWPMNVWLSPDRKPFYGGTYFPARDGDRGVHMGFLTILGKLKDFYHSERARVEESGKTLTGMIDRMLVPEAGNEMPMAGFMHDAVKYYKSRFDSVEGGLSGPPKFPSSLPIRFLLRYYRRTGDKEVLEMVRLTLGKMAGGGMYDHVGGGFHRYSTDKNWLVPHFEKMLYDNALLAMDYLEAWQATGDEDFKQIVEEILRYVKRDMTSPDGAFYSATDADSLVPGGHREEGYFFTWSLDELEETLGMRRAGIVKQYYSVGFLPNFEGRHILNTPKPAAEVAADLDMTEKSLCAVIKESDDILYKTRSSRPQPIRDEKILTAWNGLMISAYARAGLILCDSEYTERAAKAAKFIFERLFVGGKLYRSYKDNAARHNAYLGDYAFFIASLMDIYEATGDAEWIKKAIKLDGILENNYEDVEKGGFFMTGKDHEKLLARGKPADDGAVPSGNSVAVMNLLRLYEFTSRDAYRKRAENALRFFSKILSHQPAALAEMLLAVDFFLDKPKEIVIITPDGKTDEAGPFLSLFRKEFLPNRILIVTSDGKDAALHTGIIPLLRGKKALHGKATAFVCESGSCKFPTDDPMVFVKQIRTVKNLN